jgi:hypothetical protein
VAARSTHRRSRPASSTTPFASAVLSTVLERLAQWRETERLAHHEGMQRNGHHQRLLFALLDHFVETVDDHVAEVARGAVAVDDRGGIVELGGVGDREQRAGAGLEPERLVIGGPIHHVLVAGLFQEVGRDVALRGRRAHPALGRTAFAPDEFLRHVVDEAALVELPEVALALGIGASVSDNLVATLADAVADLGLIFVEQRIDVVRGWNLEVFEEVEQAPDADTVAVVAPSAIALLLRLALLGRIARG